MYAPAGRGSAYVPKRHDGVPRGAGGDVGTSAATAGDGVYGLERPGVGKGERGGRGSTHVVNAHEAVEPARDDNLIRGTPRRCGWCGGDSVHGGGPLRRRCVLVLRGAQRHGRRRGDGGGCDRVDGERGVGGGAKCGERGRGRGGEKRGPGARVQIDHVRDGGGGGWCGRGDVEKTGFAVGRQGEEAVAGDGEGFYEVAIMEIEGGSEEGVDGKINLAGVAGREPDALEFAVLKADEERAVGAAVLGAREAGDVVPGRIAARVELVGGLEYDARSGALVLGGRERVRVQGVAGGDEQARLVYREEGLQLAFPRPGERPRYEALFLPGPVRHGVVLDLDQRAPEREALRQAVGRPGEIAEDAPSAKLVYLWRVSWQGRYRNAVKGGCVLTRS